MEIPGGSNRIMPINYAALFKLIVPAVLIGLALWLRPLIDTLGGEGRLILAWLPYLLCAVSVFLALQFDRCRLLLATSAIAVVYWVTQTQLQVSLSQPQASQYYLAASLVVPVLSLYLLLVPETGIRNLQGAITTLLFAFLLLSVMFIARSTTVGDEGSSMAAYFSLRPATGYVMSLGATALVAVAALLGLALLVYRNQDTDAALIGILVALYLMLAQLHLPYVSIAMGTVAGGCLVWGLLRSSHAMAYRDELTGLLGRRALNERLRRLRRNYCIAMLDVDHFKRFNDTHGHEVGDEVLKMVSSRISQVGGGGTAYRYGGEEFCVVFPGKPREECAEALEQVREGIANYSMSIRDRARRPTVTRNGSRKRGATRLNRSHVAVTISAGVAARSDELATTEAVIAAADGNLYRAKQRGRNRVIY